jgi:hypothetical protein
MSTSRMILGAPAREVRFALDSSLEGDGFEPLVPAWRPRPRSRRSSRHASRDRRQATERRPLRASRTARISLTVVRLYLRLKTIILPQEVT